MNRDRARQALQLAYLRLWTIGVKTGAFPIVMPERSGGNGAYFEDVVGPVPGSTATTTGLPWRTLGLIGSGAFYSADVSTNVGTSFGNAMTDQSANGSTAAPVFALSILAGTYAFDKVVTVGTSQAIIRGSGGTATIFQPTQAGFGGTNQLACLTSAKAFNWLRGEITDLTFDGSNLTSNSAIGVTPATGFTTDVNMGGGTGTGAVTLVVDAAGPTATFYVLIDSEIIFVSSAGTTTSWGVLAGGRGQFGTTAANHADEAVIRAVFPYTHGTTGATPATRGSFVTVSGGTINSILLQPLGGSNTTTLGTSVSRLWMNLGDILLPTYSVTPTTFAFQAASAYMDLTAAGNPHDGLETGSPVYVRNVYFTTNTNINVCLIGDGCEDARLDNVHATASGYVQWQVNNGTFEILGGKFAGAILAGQTVNISDEWVIGNCGLIWTGYNALVPETLNLSQCYSNGITNPNGDTFSFMLLIYSNVAKTQFNFQQCWLKGSNNVAVGSFVGGPCAIGANLSGASFNGDWLIQGGLNNGSAFYVPFQGASTLKAVGQFNMVNNANFTNANAVTNMVLNGNIMRNGTTTTYVGGQLGAGLAVSVITSVTAQKSETGSADGTLLSFTPTAVASTYRITVAVSVASATNGVIGFTVAYHDAEAATVTDVAFSIFQLGTAAPANTFTVVSGVARHYGTVVVDCDSSASPIVVKWVGGGTSAALVTCTVERVN